MVTKVAGEHGLPLAADEEESMVLRGGEGHKERSNELVEKVKWLGVIVDERLELAEHWRHRIGKPRSLLRALGGVGNSKWGNNPVSWRAAYTGMIRSMPCWGVEVGCREQREWKKEMTLVQNAALCKTLGAVKGSSSDKISAIAAVESVKVFAEAATGRFLARTMCNPLRAGIGRV